MSDLKLTSLHIQNFRGFRDLKIDQLGRVNLIVGKNNVGKTSLLEAIELFVTPDRWNVRSNILDDRDLRTFDEQRSVDESRFGVSIHAARQLFYGPPDLTKALPGETAQELDVPDIAIWSDTPGTKRLELKLETNPEDKRRLYVQDYIDGEPVQTGSVFENVSKPHSTVLSTSCKRRFDFESVWKMIEVTPAEHEILRATQIIDERIVDIRVVGGSGKKNQKATPATRLEGSDEPQPLRNLGQGAVRTFEVALALQDARDNFLLIDDTENGLHYSVLPNLWRLIFEVAHTLDIQVFATTHSLDAVKAFEKIANAHEEEGVLIQLRRRRTDDEIVAVLADEKKLGEALQVKVDPR